MKEFHFEVQLWEYDYPIVEAKNVTEAKSKIGELYNEQNLGKVVLLGKHNIELHKK